MEPFNKNLNTWQIHYEVYECCKELYLELVKDISDESLRKLCSVVQDAYDQGTRR